MSKGDCVSHDEAIKMEATIWVDVTWLESSKPANRRSRNPMIEVILNLAVLSTLCATWCGHER
jgi:hypothetical protein